MIDQDQGVSLGTLHKVIKGDNGEEIPIYDFKIYYHYLDTLVRDEFGEGFRVEDVEK